MANFVVSVEKIQTTFTTNGTNTINLSKGQDETKCVPFYTMRFTATGNDNRTQNAVKIEMIDNAGTPAARVVWEPQGNPDGDITVDIFIVEFGANVTVQSGDIALTGVSQVAAITSVTQANSFIVFNQSRSAGGSDDFDDTFIQAEFNSDIEIVMQRRAAGGPDWDVRFYVVTSDGTDFTTEYIEDSWTDTEVGPTNLTITSVTQTKAFLICTYESKETSDDMRDAICNQAITGDTTLTWYRNHGATPDNVNASGTLGTWVVKTSGTEFLVERFATDVDAAATTTQAITAIDETQAILVSNQNVGCSAWPVNSSIDGADIEKWQASLVFTSTTEVTLQRRLDTAIDGSNNNIRFEVIEFELEAAAAVGTGAPTLEAFSVSAIGVHIYKGTGVPDLATMSLASVGVMQPKGVGAPDLQDMNLVALGIQKFIGVGAPATQDMSLVAQGVQKFIGTSVPTLADMVIDASGVMVPAGVGALELVAEELAAVGQIPFEGVGALDLSDMSLVSIGEIPFEGVGAPVLSAMSLTTVGVMVPKGIGTPEFRVFVISAVGVAIEPEGIGALVILPMDIVASGLMLPEGVGTPEFQLFILNAVGAQAGVAALKRYAGFAHNIGRLKVR